MISTDEFFDTLRVRIDRELETQGELEGDNKENILTRIMIEDLSSGNNPAIRGAQEIYTYANTNINAKINGFFIDDAENSVIVYITALNSSNELRRLNSHEVESLFKKLHSFMLNIVKNPSRMFDIIHEDNPYSELLYDLAHNSIHIDSFSYVLLTNYYVGELKLKDTTFNSKKVCYSI